MKDRKENLPEPSPCNWCQPKSQFPNIKDGDGRFADVDVDFNQFSYPGIPVCGGCGGLGCQFETEDFKERTHKIMDLRFQFHPTDDLPEPPTPVVYYSLRNLVNEVRGLVKEYGGGDEGSFANEIAGGRYDNALKIMSEEIDESIEYIKAQASSNDPDQRATQPALLALYEGRFDEGLKLMADAAAENPNSSVIEHDLATTILNYKRDVEEALPHYIKSTELEPKKTLHFVQTGKLLLHIENFEDSIPFFEKAQLQSDYQEFVDENDSDIPRLLERLYEMTEENRRNRSHLN